MPSLKGIAAAAFAFVLVGLAATASAQSMGKATIDFPFVAGKTECPAGTYNFDASGGKVVLKQEGQKGATVVLLVITRLGRHDTDNATELVFDKVDGKRLLSEVWLGNGDGYLVASGAGDHEHTVVGGSKPRK
jgi:hypothetical protein